MASHTSPLTALVVPEPSDAGTPGFGWSSPSPSQSSGGNHVESRAQRAASKRRAASEWIGMALGVSVPHETDQAFRRALADGVTLCRLVNWLRPGSIPKVVEATPDGSGTPSHATGDVIQTFENVTNFIRVARDLTGETFSARDLEEGGEERPGVAGCILGLRDLAAGRTPPGPRSSPGPWSTPGGQGLPPLPSPASGARASVGAGPGQAAPRPTPPPRPGFSFTPAAAQLVAKHGLAAAAADAPDGLNHLMRSCTHMLRSRMGLGASSPAPDAGPRRGDEAEAGSAQAPVPAYALDAVGPVLESVLSNLTSEYEKRLLAKDQEFKLAQEAQERMRRQITRLQAEMGGWRAQAQEAREAQARAATAREGPAAPDTAGAGIAREAAAMDRAELEAARAELEAARAEAAATAARLAEAEAALLDAQAAASARAAAAEAELAGLRDRLAAFEGLQARYDAVAAQNRALYNAVQDARGALRVYCRVRPAGATGDAGASVVEPGPDGALGVYSARHGRWHHFRFDAVFGQSADQEEVYAETAPLVRSVLDGYNVCIFAYGQTGSGKTHTMSGTDVGRLSGRGVNYRTLDDLFALRAERAADARYAIRVQLLEIYNETLRDLLVEGAAAGGQARSLALNNTARSGVNVPDATQVTVECTEDVLRVMELGARNRAVAETRMNERSSRSHQVLTILVEGEDLNTRARTHACLHLIDLAGSERIGKSGAEGQQLVEAQHINKSLSALGNVMHALASKSAHIPFRDSKLTQLLQDSLAGQAKTMMFVHVAPEASSLSETLSTLNFGKGVTEITLGAARKNTEPGAVFEARDAAGRHEREAAAARVALAERSARCEELEGEVEALHLALAAANRMAAEGRAAAAAERSGGEGGGGIPAFRPATGEAPAGRRAAEAGPGAAPVLAREPGSAPVTSAAPGPARTAASAPPPPEGLGKAAAGRMLPAMAKLNLGRLIEGEGSPASQASGRSPLLAGAGSRVSRIPGLTPPPATARPARSSPSSTSSIPRPMSARGQSGESRRASLTGDGGPGPLPSSRLSSGRSVAPRVDTGRGAGVRAAPGAPLASRTSSGGSVMAPLSSRTSSSRRWA
ncbi:KIN14B [Auxenochlorella protothecoides x Auxenochlorella symbiontica]